VVRVACIQTVSTDEPEENFKLAMEVLEREFSGSDCELVVFPENFLYFGSALNSQLQEKFEGYLEAFRQFAKNNSINLVLGSLPFPASLSLSSQGKQRYFSRSLLINISGEVQAYYDKQHLFDVEVGDEHGEYRESDTFCPGERTVVETISFEDGTQAGIGFSICYDLRFPEMYQDMRRARAKILLVPSAFTEKTGQAHWELLLRARAIENQCFVIAANQGGEHSRGRKTWGQSMIIDPWGNILNQLGKGAGICSANLDFKGLNKIRAAMPLFSS
jgi:predicted amidohydrolase